MNAGKFHQIWIEQCEAAQTIRERYGLEAAFDYAVGEKLMNFASAAHDRPAFASELPRFVSEAAAYVFGRRNSHPTWATRMRAERKRR